MSVFNTPSKNAAEILALLKSKHNVLIAGPPATGKSRLLAEVRHWFCQPTSPGFQPKGRSPFPAGAAGVALRDAMPSPERADRKAFQITFHQGTKHRDFVSGLVPNTIKGAALFKVVTGPLIEACEHASSRDGVALLEIDEINRGHAVSVFGDSITAIEGDKRLTPDGKESPMTSKFRSLETHGNLREVAVPFHVYLLAAMNQADTSVEPLDVAFLRRFAVYILTPDEPAVRDYFALPPTSVALPAPESATPTDILDSCVTAWRVVNDRITLARGAEFQLGHGIFMEVRPPGAIADVGTAAIVALQVWSRVFTHVTEVFFGDTRGLAAAIGAGTSGHPFIFEELDFADAVMPKLSQVKIDVSNIYHLLRAIALSQ